MLRGIVFALVVAATSVACGRESKQGDNPDHECPKGAKPMGKNGDMLWCEKTAGDAVVKDGPFRAWWPTGKLSQQGAFAAGERVGAWTSWWDTGVKQEEGSYDQGKKTGAWTTYSESGDVSAKLRFDDGVLDGRQELHNADGLRRIQCFASGEKLWEEPPTSDRSCP